MRIIQISDTHLSPGKPHFNNNWEPLVEWIKEQKPDLIIHTGDLAVDGADVEKDLLFCRALFDELPVRIIYVPGNHDIGHLPGSHQPVNAQRLARWHQHIGPDRWAEDFGNWRLIGLNSLIIGSDGEEEEAQFLWLENELQNTDGRPVAIFAHKPLFVDKPDEGDTGYWGIRPAARQRHYDLFAAHNVRLHASGHLHRAHATVAHGIECIWCPASSFIVGNMERDLPGQRILGAVIHDLDDNFRTEIVEIASLTPHLLDDVAHEVYPKHTEDSVKVSAEESN
ncbi:metallophosphoesterase [Falsochrobactrum sp. TDYN1]|uniref:Metallophosphoesterase n=1 Tax=Falsochrobactrum tianjinense TaxID=2706015 RepID=A0A949USW2_9HYPH|nr:metallophosphoesterase [Falsochrobactrum sp. TDYN1]